MKYNKEKRGVTDMTVKKRLNISNIIMIVVPVVVTALVGVICLGTAWLTLNRSNARSSWLAATKRTEKSFCSTGSTESLTKTNSFTKYKVSRRELLYSLRLMPFYYIIKSL